MNNDKTTQDVLEYNTSNVHILNEICLPLTSLGFDTFFYSRIYLNNPRVFSLCTNLPWAKYFRDQNILTSPRFLSAINTSIKTKNCKLIIPKIDAAETFGVFNIISNFDCIQDQYVENWGFASSSADLNTVEMYINNAPTFRKFLAYFKDRAKEIIIKAERNNIYYSIADLFTGNTPCQDELDFGGITPRKWHVRINNVDVFLSEQQMKCFYYVINGSSVKEISRVLDVSPKTIEFHLTQLKEKLHCSYKSELIKIAQKNFINKFTF